MRKPVALFLLMCGGGFALMPIVTGIVSRPTRVVWAGTLTAVLYAGWIISSLWLISARSAQSKSGCICAPSALAVCWEK